MEIRILGIACNFRIAHPSCSRRYQFSACTATEPGCRQVTGHTPSPSPPSKRSSCLAPRSFTPPGACPCPSPWAAVTACRRLGSVRAVVGFPRCRRLGLRGWGAGGFVVASRRVGPGRGERRGLCRKEARRFLGVMCPHGVHTCRLEVNMRSLHSTFQSCSS